MRRAVDEQASDTFLKDSRVGEGPKHDPADLAIETCPLRGVSGGELHAGRINEQLLDAREGLFETPCLERLCHVRCASQLWAIADSCERTDRGGRCCAVSHIWVAAASSRAVEIHAHLDSNRHRRRDKRGVSLDEKPPSVRLVGSSCAAMSGDQFERTIVMMMLLC